MTTSVAMCTYNGARYIEEQLRSIINQTVPVGEIVICDDRSTDNTIEIIEKVAKEVSTPIHVYVNEMNLGCVANFEKAIHLCKGDIIFLSDQDDLWMQDKVEVITNWFKLHPTMNVVFSDAILIDELGEPIMKSQIPYFVENKRDDLDSPAMLWEDTGFSSLSQKQFDAGLGLELWFQMNRATGATMAFRGDFGKNLQLTRGKDYHDFVLSLEALLVNSLGYIVAPLTYYPQHIGQTIGCAFQNIYTSGWDDARTATFVFSNMFESILKSDRDKLRCKFYADRVSFKHGLFGCRVLSAFIMYIRCYNKKWFYFLSYDYKNAVQHSLVRIKNKLRKHI